MLKVLDFPIPTPLLREPLSFYLVAVGSCLVVGIAPQVKWSCGIVIHINSKAIDLAPFEAVPCQEVVGGCSRAILELSLDSNVDTERDNILRPSVVLAVSAWTIFCIPHLGNVVWVDVRVSMNMKTLKWLDITTTKRKKECSEKRERQHSRDNVSIIKRSIVSRDSNHDVIRVLGVDLDVLLKAPIRECTNSIHRLGVEINSMCRLSNKLLVKCEVRPFLVGDEHVIFEPNSVSPLMLLLQMGTAERLEEPVVSRRLLPHDIFACRIYRI